MTLTILARLIDKALKMEPLKPLQEIYGDYYQPYYSLMYLLAGQFRSGQLVELGVEKGRGLASMAYGSNFNQVIGFDNNHLPEIDDIIERFKFGNMHFYHQPSLPVAEFIDGVALLHVDTEHSHAQARSEFEAYRPHLIPGAVVLFDDLHAQEDSVLEFFLTLPYPKIQDDRLHPICGYGVMIYET